MIKLSAIGHLGKDAIINQVNGKQVINFSIAHTEKYKDKDGNQQEKTTWVECAYWSDSKVGQYLNKGTQVYIEGQPEVRSYESNGKQGVSLVCRVGKVELLGGNSNKQDSAPQQTQPVTQESIRQSNLAASAASTNDELPF